MLAKSIVVVALVVCLAGPIVSWNQLNGTNPFGSTDADQYTVCSLLVKTAKETHFFLKQKALLDQICALKKDKIFLDKCKKTVAKYLDDIAKQDPEKVCQQMKLPDKPNNDAIELKGEPERSVCEYLVDYANSKGLPYVWVQPLRSICPKMGKGRVALCQKTIIRYYHYMTNDTTKEFCARFNLVDV